MSTLGPPPITDNFRIWAQSFTKWVQRSLPVMVSRRGYDTPSEDGVLLWDRSALYPIVSRSNAFREVVVKNTVPASSVGVAGDKAGLVSWDANYIYVCTASHNGSANIWKRATLSSGAF